MTVTLPVKVVPGASRSSIVGWLGHELKLRISAPPEKGKANKSVEQLLARHLGLSPRQVNIVRGHGCSHKQVEIQGLDQVALTTAFGQPDKN